MHRRSRAAAVALALLLPGAAAADRLERAGEGFRLGEVRLAPYQRLRAVADAKGPQPAFRFDGNSNWLQSAEPLYLKTDAGLSLGVWVALAAPPADRASVIEIGGTALRLSLNPWRQPELRVGGLRVASPQVLPVGAWVHLAGTVEAGRLRLYIDGALAGEVRGVVPSVLHGRVVIGRNPAMGLQETVHPLGTLNATLAQLTLLQRQSAPVAPGPPPGAPPAPGAPAAWFAADADRPTLFPMGPTGWTNEPHALTWRDGLWHLYHQANPNGAYWRSIVWGHLTSADLATWQPRFPALVPGTGFDRRGAWVGSWIPEVVPPAVLYTGVNGAWAGLGIAALRGDGGLEQVAVAATDTPEAFQDMRDPFVLREGDGWAALIGAGESGDEKALVYRWRSADGRAWRPEGPFDVGGARMPGEYWELPMLIPFGARWVLFGTPVQATLPARTLYWIGSYDGTRFRPDSPEPQQYDALATLRAPTIASGQAGGAVAIGIIADELRGEPARHRAGWTHVLGPAMEIELCAEDEARLCHRLAPGLVARFAESLPVAADGGVNPLERRAALLRGVVRGGVLTLALHPDGAGRAAATLRLDAVSGEAVLDYGAGPLLPRNRAARIVGRFPPAETLALDLAFDGAAVAGTLNGMPAGFLAFPADGTPRGFALRLEAGAVVEAMTLHAE